MKNSLRTFLCATVSLLTVQTTLAQVPANGGFEVWEQNGPGENPQSWYSADDFYFRNGNATFDVGLVDKSTDRQSGNSAARLQTANVTSGNQPVRLRSFLVLGNRINFQDLTTKGGIAYTARPTSMQFWYKLTTGPNDRGVAYAVLTRGSGSTLQTIGFAEKPFSASDDRDTYGQVNQPFVYNPNLPANLAPDSLRIIFLIGTGNGATGTTTLHVDDVSITNAITSSKNSQLQDALSVYPNPSTDGEFALASLSNPAVATAPYTVTDALGRVVLKQGKAASNLANGRPVNLRNEKPGVYLLRLETPDGPVTQKLVIR